MSKKYTGAKDEFGRQKTTYHNVKHYANDFDEAVRDIEERMIRYCEAHQIDFSFVDKIKLSKKMGCYTEYRNAIYGKRKFN